MKLVIRLVVSSIAAICMLVAFIVVLGLGLLLIHYVTLFAASLL